MSSETTLRQLLTLHTSHLNTGEVILSARLITSEKLVMAAAVGNEIMIRHVSLWI